MGKIYKLCKICFKSNANKHLVAITQIICSLLCVYVMTPASSCDAEWNCRNYDMEISCDSNKCIANSEGFTPMDVHVGNNGSISVCAYSGCWEGKGKLFKSGNQILVSGQKLSWTGTSPSKTDFIIGIDKIDNVAVIKGAGFAMPLICNKTNVKVSK